MVNQNNLEKVVSLFQEIDISEDSILQFDKNLLKLLLKDKTTGKNITWSTKDYESLGIGYEEFSEITPALITGDHTAVIQPRITKDQDTKIGRTRNKAEVFTPCWICNNQNNLVDNQWFGEKNIFNTEIELSWISTMEKVSFLGKKRSWQKYVDAQRLEISCGEAPYLVSRYDTVTGEKIDVKNRIGLLDRKMRIVDENAETAEEWKYWALRAYQSVYGYEFQGDNLLIARENLLCSYIDYYWNKFNVMPDKKLLRQIALIISWNILQMDGLKCVIPNSCKPSSDENNTFWGIKLIEKPCPGCTSNNIYAHTGIYCKIQDWRTKAPVRFIDMLKG